MKKILFLFTLLSLGLFAKAQIYDPVDWKFEAKDVTEKEATLVITATIDRGWHVYSQFIEEGGPIPTSFKFEGAGFAPIGGVTESPKAVGAFDPNFNMQIAWHKNEVKFSQKIRLSKPQVTVEGMVEFMVCNDTHCLPPEEVPFTIQVNAPKAAGGSALKDNAVEEIGAVSAGGTAAGLDSVIEPDSALTDDSISDSVDVVSSLSEPSKPTTTDDASTADKSLWGIFIAGLIGGFAAFLMPCIYPMVPLTTSYFTKQSGSRKKGIWNAVIYGLSIIIIYVGLGMVITLIFGASALNEAASSATFNLLFFVLILV